MKKFPRLIVAAVSSGCGKTTIVTGLIAALRSRGLSVQPYKIGPDYIDTGWHAEAAGRPAHNLDSWLIPTPQLRSIFASTFDQADVAIIEGVMGLYDGGRRGVSSTAQIAKLLNAPIVLIIDAKSIGASAAAIALGFRQYDPAVNIIGVILNRIGSKTHQQMIEDALNAIDMRSFGAIRRDTSLIMPERHLGLVQAAADSSDLIDKIRAAIEDQIDVDALINAAKNAADIDADNVIIHRSSNSCKIGVARDEAFSFYYPESLAVLESLGADLIEFSPLHDSMLPNVDGLIIGGGYPELYADQLAANVTMIDSIRAVMDKIPIYAECGGYMYLMKELIDFDGRSHKMIGAIDARAKMNDRLQMVGYVEATLDRDCVIGRRGDIVRAHEFHFSNVIAAPNDPIDSIFNCIRLRNDQTYRAGFANDNIVASYLHLHFVGCPSVAENFVARCCR